MDSLRVGFIGLGDMGMAMARCLPKAGFTVTVYDLLSEAMEKMGELGAKAASSCREVAEKSDIIISMVLDIPQNEAVIFGKDGLWEGLSEGKILIISSTVSPEYVQKLYQKCKEIGVHVIDAGVSDVTGPVHYKEGCLTLMIGGDEEPVKRSRPVFEAMGEHIFHLGPVGYGMKYKLINNLSTLNCSMVTRECLNLGLKAGLDLRKMIEVLSVSTGGTVLLQSQAYMMKEGIQIPAPPTPLPKDAALAKSNMSAKDKNHALELGKAVDAPVPISRFLDEVDPSTYTEYYAEVSRKKN